MNLHHIQERITTLCPFVKEIAVTMENGHPFAFIYPNFETLKSAQIINIESEIRWYGVELYNMEVEESKKVRGYFISTYPLPRTTSQEFDITEIKKLPYKTKQHLQTSTNEPCDNLYQTIKTQLCAMSDEIILPSSHLELDLGLDSLDYVELFVFIES